MKQEFYDIAFRKQIYSSIEQLQQELDKWLEKYNNFRPHSGNYCYGKTPMQTFKDAKAIAISKNIGNIMDTSDTSTYLAETV